MAYPIDKKLVIAVSSRALFNLDESHDIYVEKGIDEYKKHQEKNIDTPLDKGAAFPFIKRFLNINKVFPDKLPVEVVILSKNSSETGLRVFRSIKHYGLDISRAAFMSGEAPYEYIPAFNASLFLSANEDDVKMANKNGYPAGLVLPAMIQDSDDNKELNVAFDFDGVIADDESESVFQKNKNLHEFHEHETANVLKPHNPGPLADLFTKLSFMQKLEKKEEKHNKDYQKILKISIITARNAPAHERVLTTLKSWGVAADHIFFLGGMDKSRILKVLKPHMFFDDQLSHLQATETNIPMVHIPYGAINQQT